MTNFQLGKPTVGRLSSEKRNLPPYSTSNFSPEKISEPIPVKPGTLYNVLPDSRWEFFFDNYTITTHTTCEQKFEYAHIEHLGTPGRGFARDVGIWWHECMAFFYKAMQRGKTLSRGDFVAGGLYSWNKLKMEEIEQFAPKQYQRFDGRNGAVVMLDRYYDVGTRDQQLFDVVAVESGFGYNREVKVGETDKIVLYYTGRPDLIIKMRDSAHRTMPLDHKSVDRVTGNENKMFKPHGQTAGYIFTAETLLRKHEPDLLKQFRKKHPKLGNRSRIINKLIGKYLQGRIVLGTN